jgi:hypothetical protein
MDLTNASFNLFLSETDAEYWDILYHTEVGWLSHRTALKNVLALKPGIEMCMNAEDSTVVVRKELARN